MVFWKNQKKENLILKICKFFLNKNHNFVFFELAFSTNVFYIFLRKEITNHSLTQTSPTLFKSKAQTTRNL